MTVFNGHPWLCALLRAVGLWIFWIQVADLQSQIGMAGVATLMVYSAFLGVCFTVMGVWYFLRFFASLFRKLGGAQSA